MTRRKIRLHPAFGLLDHATGEPLTPGDELARRWRMLGEEVRQDVEEDWFQRVVGELIVEVNDDLGDVFLYLTDDELRNVQQVLRI